MRTKFNQRLMLLSIVLAVSVRSAIPEVAQNPICPAPGAVTLDVEALQDTVEFDHWSFARNSQTDDSVGIFVKNGDLSDPFKMTAFDPDIQQRIEIDCLETEGFNFVGLINHLLVLKNPANSKYYLCALLDPQASSDLNIVQLALPSGSRINNHNRFKPFYYGEFGGRLYVAVGNDDETSIQEYTLPGQIGVSAPALTPTSIATKIGDPLDSFVGTAQFIFDKTTNLVYYYSSDQWMNPATDPIPAGLKWEVVTLFRNRVVIMEMTNGMESGKIIYTESFHILQQDDATLPAQTLPYLHQNDGIKNFIIYSGDVFYWLNLDFNGNQRSELLTGGEIRTDGIDSIGLSGNKLTILYDGQITYYRMVGVALQSSVSSTAQIEHIMTKTFTESIEADGTYRFGLECICKGVRKFACYSSTLNCLIIKKADVECGDKDIPVAAAD